jgi:hypothetical protein
MKLNFTGTSALPKSSAGSNQDGSKYNDLLTLTEKNALTDDIPLIQEPRLWQDELWTARVIKNEDDDGWAVAMFKTGQVEPALVGPWTMGRDKKNPKPLDGNAFITLVKTAGEFVRRSEQQLHSSLHQSLSVQGSSGRITALFDIEPDDENPSATLSAQDEGGELLVQWKVDPTFKFNRHTVQAWVDSGMKPPARAGQF